MECGFEFKGATGRCAKSGALPVLSSDQGLKEGRTRAKRPLLPAVEEKLDEGFRGGDPKCARVLQSASTRGYIIPCSVYNSVRCRR